MELWSNGVMGTDDSRFGVDGTWRGRVGGVEYWSDGVMEWWRDEGGAETAKRRQVGALQMFLVLALSLPWGKARGAPNDDGRRTIALKGFIVASRLCLLPSLLSE
jgi:hypothetical protein